MLHKNIHSNGQSKNSNGQPKNDLLSHSNDHANSQPNQINRTASEGSINLENSPHPDISFDVFKSLNAIQRDNQPKKTTQHQNIINLVSSHFPWLTQKENEINIEEAKFKNIQDHYIAFVDVKPKDGSINLLNMTAQQNEFLANFIALYSIVVNKDQFVLFVGEQTLEYLDENAYELNVSVNLSHTIIVRKRKNRSGFRMDVIDDSNVIDKGSDGVIKPVLATYKTNAKGLFEKFPVVPLVVKQYLLPPNNLEQASLIVNQEAIIGKFVGNGFKEPVHAILNNQHYIFSLQHFISEKNLYDVLTKELPSTIERVQLSEDIAHRLRYFHLAHLVHKDIKPENIMCLSNGKTKLIDFVSSKHKHHNDAGKQGGTKGYKSPEVERRENSTQASDRYSLGRVIYYILNHSQTISELSKDDISHINNMISELMNDVPEKRCSLDFVIETFRNIRWSLEDIECGVSKFRNRARASAVAVNVLLSAYISIEFKKLKDKHLEELINKLNIEISLLPNNQKALTTFLHEAHLEFIGDFKNKKEMKHKIIGIISEYRTLLQSLKDAKYHPTKREMAYSSLKRRQKHIFSLENLANLNKKIKKDLQHMDNHYREIPKFVMLPFGMFMDTASDVEASQKQQSKRSNGIPYHPYGHDKSLYEYDP